MLKYSVLIIVFLFSFHLNAKSWEDYSDSKIESLIEGAFGIKLGYPIKSSANSNVEIISSEYHMSGLYKLKVAPPTPSPYFKLYEILITQFNGYVLQINANISETGEMENYKTVNECRDFIIKVGNIQKSKYASLAPDYISKFWEFDDASMYHLKPKEYKSYINEYDLIEIYCGTNRGHASFYFNEFMEEQWMLVREGENELYNLQNNKIDTTGFE
jgi:hypothetical protein